MEPNEVGGEFREIVVDAEHESPEPIVLPECGIGTPADVSVRVRNIPRFSIDLASRDPVASEPDTVDGGRPRDLETPSHEGGI